MVYLTRSIDDLAVIWYAKEFIPNGADFLEVEELPEGPGVLKTDLVNVWKEEIKNTAAEKEEPTDQDRIEAQVLYTALLTNTLLE